MKPGTILLIAAVLGISVIIYFKKIRGGEENASGPDGKSGTSSVLSVNGFVTHPEKVKDVIFTTGTLYANNEIEVRNEIAGKVTGIFFKEGTPVKKGDLLVKIYDKDLKAALKKLQYEEEQASREEKRQKDLLEINGVSRQDYEEALNTLNMIRADIEGTNSNISKTEIRAPFDGVAGLKNINIGEYLPVNTSIVSLQDLDPMKLDFSIPEKYRLSAEINSILSFRVEGIEKPFTATVYAMEPSIDLQTKTLLLRAICENHGQQLLPGVFAKIEFPLRTIPQALMIPTQAVIPEFNGQKIFLVKDGKAFPVMVKLGIRNDSTVQVTEGISAGDTVLTTGIMQIRKGAPVHVKL